METYLKKEDVDNKLFVHLVHLNAFNVVPFPKWFNSCFAGVLPETALERWVDSTWEKHLQLKHGKYWSSTYLL